MKAALLTIGDELLNGQTIDTNSAWLGQQLNKIGVQVVLKLSVGDKRDAIINGLNYAYQEANMVIVTGGLGPTKDDITKSVIAEYFNDNLTFDEVTFNRIKSYFERTNRQPTKAHREQSFMPTKANLLQNNRGTAPGMWIQEGKKILLSMPGVPSEMKGIMEDLGLSRIAALNPEQHIQHYIIQTAGLGETYIEERIEDLIDEFPDQLNIAYLPGIASVKLRITAMGTDAKYLSDQKEYFGSRIADRLGTAVVSIGNKKIEEAIGVLAVDKNIKIGTAESCTGGYIAQLITSIPGSSAYFKGSIIAYSNNVKISALDVLPDTLALHGAVSEQTVVEMVQGLLKNLELDVAVAVSGIAGPGGGTVEKPVGTIWIAVGNKEKTITKKLHLIKNRDLNIRYTAITALNQLRLFLMEL